MSLNKWNILNENFVYETIENRFTILDEKLSIYLENNSEENLHDVRISLRRLRYTLEVFSSFFEKSWYESFYKKVSKLQNITGKARDLDVIKEYLIRKELPQDDRIEEDKEKLENKAIKKLYEFIDSKSYKKFKKFISNKKENL
jgi:CHAD domain-containing protein